MAEIQGKGRYAKQQRPRPSRPVRRGDPAGEKKHGEAKNRQIVQEPVEKDVIIAKKERRNRDRAQATMNHIVERGDADDRKKDAEPDKDFPSLVDGRDLAQAKERRIHRHIGRRPPPNLVEAAERIRTIDVRQDIHARQMVRIIHQIGHVHDNNRVKNGGGHRQVGGADHPRRQRVGPLRSAHPQPLRLVI